MKCWPPLHELGSGQPSKSHDLAPTEHGLLQKLIIFYPTAPTTTTRVATPLLPSKVLAQLLLCSQLVIRHVAPSNDSISYPPPPPLLIPPPSPQPAQLALQASYYDSLHVVFELYPRCFVSTVTRTHQLRSNFDTIIPSQATCTRPRGQHSHV